MRFPAVLFFDWDKLLPEEVVSVMLDGGVLAPEKYNFLATLPADTTLGDMWARTQNDFFDIGGWLAAATGVEGVVSRSACVGDIFYHGGVFYRIAGVGFEKLTDEQQEQFRAHFFKEG